MVEQPKYNLIKQDGKIEIREYSKYVIAKTSIKQTDTNQTITQEASDGHPLHIQRHANINPKNIH